MKYKWLCDREDSDRNILDYVTSIKEKLSKPCKIARKNLKDLSYISVKGWSWGHILFICTKSLPF